MEDWQGRVFKYCPKCGAAALQTGEKGKLLRCAACGFELYLNAAAAVAAIIEDDQGRVLITVRGKEPGKGQWDLPGGFVDPGESAEEALRREVREEVGLELTAMRYLGSNPNTYEYRGVRYATTDLVFVCRVQDLSKAKPAKKEIKAILFKQPEEIDPSRFAFGSLAKLVEQYLGKTGPAE